jgi:hypothetical protein
MPKTVFTDLVAPDKAKAIASASASQLEQYDKSLAQLGYAPNNRARTQIAIRQAQLAKKPISKALRERAAELNLELPAEE